MDSSGVVVRTDVGGGVIDRLAAQDAVRTEPDQDDETDENRTHDVQTPRPGPSRMAFAPSAFRR